jgi:hypothetical protein
LVISRIVLSYMCKIEANMTLLWMLFALSYPLFLLRGELGWHMDIPKKELVLRKSIHIVPFVRLVVV